MRDLAKHELPRGAGRFAAPSTDRPTGQRQREAGHVGLRVAAVDAQRVQLEYFPGEVLVDVKLPAAATHPTGGALCEPGVRTDRRLIVEVENHRRMRFDCLQHVDESAANPGTNRFVLERRRERHHRRLVRGHREMIGPEMNQSFAK